MQKSEMLELAEIVATSVVNALEKKGMVGNAKPSMSDKSAYAKTEALLYNYRGFQRIVAERKQEIEDLRKYGVPGSSPSFDYVPKSNVVNGLVTEDERVEAAVHNVEASVQGTVQAIALIDKCMATLKNDPYYRILELFYFDRLTQEDIMLEFNCTQPNVSYHRKRLVRELALRMFPDQIVNELIN